MKKHSSETKIIIGFLNDINFSVCKLNENLGALIEASSYTKTRTNRLVGSISPVI